MALNDIIKNIDYMKIKAPSGLTYAQELVNAANLLRECIQEQIKPHRKHPNESMQNILSVSSLADVKVDGTRLTVTMKMQNSIRPSLYKKWNKTDANVFWLLNDGYKVKKDVWFKNIRNFGYRAAERFVENGIKDFNEKNKLGIKVEVVRPLYYYGRDF